MTASGFCNKNSFLRGHRSTKLSETSYFNYSSSKVLHYNNFNTGKTVENGDDGTVNSDTSSSQKCEGRSKQLPVNPFAMIWSPHSLRKLNFRNKPESSFLSTAQGTIPGYLMYLCAFCKVELILTAVQQLAEASNNVTVFGFCNKTSFLRGHRATRVAETSYICCRNLKGET